MLSTRPKTRIAIIVLLAIAALGVFSVIIHQAFLPILAWFIPALEVPFYDLAVYGAYPEQEYVSFDIPSSQPNLVKWDYQCDSGHVFVTLNGPSIAHPGPSIYDARGELVWTTEEFGTVLNMRLQRYKGEKYLTFWAGKKAGTMGQGSYYMLDSSYNISKKLDAVGENYHGDLHEFKITDDDTALITVYTPKQVDLTDLGHWRGKEGWVVDSMFQEIDLATGDLLFEWSAADHFPPSESYMTNPFAGYSESTPFDSFHINSVDKEPASGNYMISSRHTHTISLIDGRSGEILWQLGGKHNAFKDLSEGLATDFSWQHDARWIGLPSDANGEEGIYTISFFANGMAGALHVDASHSTARIVRLDTNAMTAELLQSFASYQQTLASSQGSVEILPESGNVFVGWGASAAWSEFAADGTLLCEAHLAAYQSFAWERVKSYRVFKTAEWVGKPIWKPSARIAGGKVFVSWNGATEIASWELQGRKSSSDGEWKAVDEVEKSGFEDAFAIPTAESWADFRVVALDKGKSVLGTSEVAEKVSSGSWSWRLFMFALIVSGVAAVVWAVNVYLRKRRGFKAGLFAWDKDGRTGVRYSPL